MEQHFTASAVVLRNESVLLVYHLRLKAWVPPGGHIESGELPEHTAVRETFEETGLEVEALSSRAQISSNDEACVLKQPLCVQRVYAVEQGQSVIHLDLVYLCRPAANAVHMAPAPEAGSLESRWVLLRELGSLQTAPNVVEVIGMAVIAKDVVASRPSSLEGDIF